MRATEPRYAPPSRRSSAVRRIFVAVLGLLSCLLASPPAIAAEPQSTTLRAQVDAERLAIRLTQRPDIQAALAQAAAEWRRNSPGLLPESYAQLDASLRELLFMAALQIIDNDPTRPEVIEISAAPHRWFGISVPGGRWGINNPDTLYFTIPVAPGSRYVITGRRHGAGPTDVNFTAQTGADWVASDNIAKPDLKVEPDGTYRITVDDQPAAGRPNHLRIGGGANVVLIRNTLGDWSREAPDTLGVTRVSGPSLAPRRSEDELARQLVARLQAVVQHSVNGLQNRILRQAVNVVPQPGGPADKPGFLVTQRNTLAHFRLADDEAIVATFDPGGAGYATFPVTNIWGVTPDSRTHQNSLNNRQAVANADGTITVVLANWDPGVANWIDPAGLHEGIVMLRWQLLAPAARGHGPSVHAQVVRRADLASALPGGVRRITPDQRLAQLRARAAAFDRRFTVR